MESLVRGESRNVVRNHLFVIILSQEVSFSLLKKFQVTSL